MKQISSIAILLLLFGCIGTTPLKDLNENPADYLGEKITVSGTVENTVKIGTLSGYTLRDGNASIRVSSRTLPAEGDSVTVTGTWNRDTLFGYYLLAESG